MYQKPKRIFPSKTPPQKHIETSKPKPKVRRKTGFLRKLISKKLIFAILIVAAVALWKYQDQLINKSVRQLIPTVQSFARANGIRNLQLWFEKAAVGLPDYLKISNIVSTVPVVIPGVISNNSSLSVRARLLKVSLLSFFNGKPRLLFNDVQIFPNKSVSQRSARDFYLNAKKMEIDLPMEEIDLSSFGVSALGIARTLSSTGILSSYFDLNGFIRFSVNKKLYQARVFTKKHEGTWRIQIMQQDIAQILGALDEEVNPKEASVVAAYPLRAVKLLRIKDKARAMSQAAFKSDKNIPEDAYRHVLWSYLLTKAYGARFAEQVTDAHEKNIESNDPDTLMDLINNRIGRNYARKGVYESGVLELVKRDKEVIWSKEELVDK